MKYPTNSISSLLFKSTASKPPLHNRFSQKGPPSHSPRLHFYHTPLLPSSFLNPQNSKIFHPDFLGSSRQQKLTSCCTPNSSNQHLKHGSLGTQLVYSTRNPKFMCRIISSDNFLAQFPEKRAFSAAPTDHFSRDAAPDDFTAVESSVGPIDAGRSMRKPMSLWPGIYHSPVTNALWEARSSMLEGLNNDVTDAPSHSELVSKPPSKSRTSTVYKFSTDYVLREQYRNPWNEIRMGKLLEDLDALAGTISIKHCSRDGINRPLLLVTASVDKIVMKKPIRVDTDLTIAGAVTWVGLSSLEIQLEVTQPEEGKPDPSEPLALTANFTFVARDSETGKSVPVNQISPQTENEQLLWEEAEERNKVRKKIKADRKRKTDDVDQNRLNELLAEGRIFSDMPALADRDSILIRDTCLQNSLICQPQQRNIHGRIFGGFLMRRAFEIGYSTAYSFAGSVPIFVDVDHVDFLKPDQEQDSTSDSARDLDCAASEGQLRQQQPIVQVYSRRKRQVRPQVDVGNFLRFKSCVLYTELIDTTQPLINVEVVAHVTRPELRSSELSNKFYFTFGVCQDAMRNGLKIRNVVPATEEEARRVIERLDAENCRV